MHQWIQDNKRPLRRIGRICTCRAIVVSVVRGLVLDEIPAHHVAGLRIATRQQQRIEVCLRRRTGAAASALPFPIFPERFVGLRPRFAPDQPVECHSAS